MEERKAWEDFLKDPQRSYDAQCKKILSLKKILAYLYKECLSEYRHLSLKAIYDRLDTDLVLCQENGQTLYLTCPFS